MGMRDSLGFLRWGPQFQRHRRLLQGPFTKRNIEAFRDLQVSESRILVKNLIEKPEDYANLLRKFSVPIFAQSLKSKAALVLGFLPPSSWGLCSVTE
jgi:cytochrome P450